MSQPARPIRPNGRRSAAFPPWGWVMTIGNLCRSCSRNTGRAANPDEPFPLTLLPQGIASKVLKTQSNQVSTWRPTGCRGLALFGTWGIAHAPQEEVQALLHTWWRGRYAARRADKFPHPLPIRHAGRRGNSTSVINCSGGVVLGSLR